MKNNEMKKLFNRVYYDKMIVDEETKLHDSEAIKQVCQKVFGDGSVTPGPETLHNFNNLIIELADEVAKPVVSDLISYLAKRETGTRGNVKQIQLPRKVKAKFIWSANGSGVDLVRVSGRSSTLAVPSTFSTGFYYEPAELVTEAVETFRELVNDLAEAKARLYFNEVAKLVDAAVSSTAIPANNVLSGSNNAITDYNKLVSRLSRYGGRPILIADPVMVDDLALKQPANSVMKELITEDYKDELLRSLNITSIGRSTAINLVNPFTDTANSKVELDHQVGYMLTSEGQAKPFSIVEYGGMRQSTETHMEDGRVKVKVEQDASIVLVYGQILGYLKDTALTL